MDEKRACEFRVRVIIEPDPFLCFWYSSNKLNYFVASTIVHGKGDLTCCGMKLLLRNISKKDCLDQCCKCPGVLPRELQYLALKKFSILQMGSLGTENK